MHGSDPAYGLWPLVVSNSAVFIIFAFSFFKPQTKRDWRTPRFFPRLTGAGQQPALQNRR